MKIRNLLALSLVATLMLVFSSVAQAADRATPVRERNPDPTAVTPTAQASNASEPNMYGPNGEKLRKPTAEEAHDMNPASWPNATRADCMAALRERNPDHRFAFVGICISGTQKSIGDSACPSKSLRPIYETALRDYVELQNFNTPLSASDITAAYDYLGETQGLSYSKVSVPYGQRAHDEWNAGDFPQGVPLRLPSMLDLLTSIGCRLPTLS